MNLAVYCLLFTAVGVGFIFVHLVLGKLIRPNRPGAEKKAIYECGEPTIGSAWIQFDLRFYVVALLFVIFDVEVAFFFPWAEVFGRANDVASLQKPTDAASYRDYCRKVLALAPTSAPHGPEYQAYRTLADMRDLGEFDRLQHERAVVDAGWGDLPEPRDQGPVSDARTLAWMAFIDILVFFGVLLVGFAYLWRRGDLAWVRSVAAERAEPPAPAEPPPAPAPPRAAVQPLVPSGSGH